MKCEELKIKNCLRIDATDGVIFIGIGRVSRKKGFKHCSSISKTLYNV